MKPNIALLAAGVAFALAAHAQIAVSASDGKQIRPGDDPPGIRPDTVSTINLNQYPPKVLATIQAPASMIGPPNAVWVSKDSTLAIVTCNQKVDPANSTKLVLAGIVSVVDISNPNRPKVVQTAVAGPGASGVSVNSAENLVLVANTSGSVSLFMLHHKKLTKVNDLQMEDGSGPTDVAFSRDGRKAYVVERGGNRLTILNVDGNKVIKSGQTIMTGALPYGMAITPDGRYEINTNLGGALAGTALIPRIGGGQAHDPRAQGVQGEDADRRLVAPRRAPHSGTVTLVDLLTDQVVDSVVVGPTPEHVVISPNGDFAEVTVANAAASSMTDPNYGATHGLLLVYGIEGGKLTKLASAETGHWCQGAVWNKDNNEILLQCATERHIEIYKFDGNSLEMDRSATLNFSARPGAIATATNQ